MFTGIFLSEAIVRITALGAFYFRVAWNVFDFIVVVLSVIGEFYFCCGDFTFTIRMHYSTEPTSSIWLKRKKVEK